MEKRAVKFGTAGIRGVYGQDVTNREAIAVCFAVNELLGNGTFGLGYDTRHSSHIMATLANAAMNWYGSDMQNYGIIPTPVLAFTIKVRGLKAGFSVTASHNPPEYAGIKVFGNEGIEFSLEAEHRLEELMRRSSGYTKHDFSYGRTLYSSDQTDEYCDLIIRRCGESGGKKFKILIDAGNGTASNITSRILREFGHHVMTVNSHPSSGFPGRLPEPSSETLWETGRLVSDCGCDFGIAHDGDADRIVMIDSDGNVLPDYLVSALLFRKILEKSKHGTVVFSYNTSDALKQLAEENSCIVKRSRLGKTFQELYAQRGIFASEPSKSVDPNWGYWEDGIYSAVVIAQYLSKLGLGLRDAVSNFPTYFDLKVDLHLSNNLDYTLVKNNAVKFFGDLISKIEDEDGVKVILKSGDWVMLRSSGTERKVRVYCESSIAPTAERLLRSGEALANSSQTIN